MHDFLSNIQKKYPYRQDIMNPIFYSHQLPKEVVDEIFKKIPWIRKWARLCTITTFKIYTKRGQKDKYVGGNKKVEDDLIGLSEEDQCKHYLSCPRTRFMEQHENAKLSEEFTAALFKHLNLSGKHSNVDYKIYCTGLHYTFLSKCSLGKHNIELVKGIKSHDNDLTDELLDAVIKCQDISGRKALKGVASWNHQKEDYFIKRNNILKTLTFLWFFDESNKVFQLEWIIPTQQVVNLLEKPVYSKYNNKDSIYSFPLEDRYSIEQGILEGKATPFTTEDLKKISREVTISRIIQDYLIQFNAKTKTIETKKEVVKIYYKEPPQEIKVTKSAYKDGINNLTDKHMLISAIGDEIWFRDQVANKLKQIHHNLERIVLDCEELTESEVFSKLLSRDLFTKKRLFIIKNFVKIKKLEFFTEKEFKDIILFDSEKAGKTKEYKDLIRKTLLIDCEKPKPWFEAGDAMGKILGYFRRYGYEDVSQDTALYLYQQVGYNLYKIISEIDKIVMYKGGLQFLGPTITIEDIDKVCIKGMHYNVYDIIDKILAGKKKDALSLLDNIFKYESNPGILLINLWYTHFENILYLKSNSKKDSELNTYIRMPPMVIQRKLIPQSQIIPTIKIMESMNYLTEVDYNLRKGSFDLKYYLEKFILDY